MPDVSVEIVGQNQPVSSSEPSSANIDFGALTAQASKMLDAAEATPEPEVTPIPAAEPDPTKVRVKAADADTPEPEVAPIAASADVVVAQKLPADLTDDTLVKVMVDGEEQIVPWGEAKGKISGGLKFTKNMQDLAKQKSDHAADLAALATLRTERSNLEAFLNNEAAVTAYTKQKFPHLFQQPTGAAGQPAAADYNPDEIATVGQARTLAEQQLAGVTEQIAAVRKSVQDDIRAANQEISDRQETAKHSVVINSTLSDIFTKHPVLNSIPNVDNLIRFEVSKMQPATQEEAVSAFKLVASGMVEEIGKHFKANQKLEAVATAKAKLDSKSIEPAGGASPSLKPTSFKDASGQVDWKKVQQAAREFQ